MTILCRLQGIPARFVAGYLVRPVPVGHAVVTGKMGHAWTEVYLKGFGWLTMDATPGTEETVFGDVPDNSPENRPTEKPQEDSRPTIPPVSEEEEEELPDPPDEPENETDEPPAETPPPEPGASPAPENGTDSRPPETSGPSPWLWLALIPPALLAGFLIRLFLTDPVRAARRRPGHFSPGYFLLRIASLNDAGI